MRYGYIFAVIFVGIMTLQGCADGKKAERHVVVLSLDGFRWDYASRANTPTLDSIRSAGSYAEMFPCFPSNTFPSHYSMATGLHPDHHGIVANTFFDEPSGRWFSMGDDESVYDPYFWRGEPIWIAAERQGLRAATFMWIGCQIPVDGRTASRNVPYDGSVSFRQRAEWVLDEMNRPRDSVARLIMWYMEEPDSEGHASSPDSPEVIAKVEHLDSLLGWFFAEARKSPVYGDTDFIVLSDHGMASLSPDRFINLYPLLDQKRIRRTINSSPLYIEPDPDYIDETVRIANEQGHMRAWRRENIPAEFHYGTDTARIMSVVVLPDVGWTVTNRENPWPPLAGNHGFDPFSREMHMIFYAFGPDFKRGYSQPSFQNHNVYLLLARLLGIAPAQTNDCDIEPLKGMLNE